MAAHTLWTRSDKSTAPSNWFTRVTRQPEHWLSSYRLVGGSNAITWYAFCSGFKSKQPLWVNAGSATLQRLSRGHSEQREVFLLEKSQVNIQYETEAKCRQVHRPAGDLIPTQSLSYAGADQWQDQFFSQIATRWDVWHGQMCYTHVVSRFVFSDRFY